MKNYYRIMQGRKSVYAEEAFRNNFIGAGWFENIDLTQKLTEDLKDFSSVMIPLYIEEHPGASKISAGLACGMLWTIAKKIQEGDIVLCPDGQGTYYIGEVTGNYEYRKGEVLPHRRPVKWFEEKIRKEDLGESLRNSMGSIGTVSTITQYADEIELLLSGKVLPVSEITGEIIESPSEFALEKHLEDFLVKNWNSTELGKLYDIYEENGEMVGQQYPSDTGPIDILAISKDRNELLVVELKRGMASDRVVGQIQRYMGYVAEELAENNQTVKGVIVAFENDIRIERALSVAPNISFYTYKLKFTLDKIR